MGGKELFTGNNHDYKKLPADSPVIAGASTCITRASCYRAAFVLCLFPAGSRCCSVPSCECTNVSVTTDSKDEPQRAAPLLRRRYRVCTRFFVIRKSGVGRQGHLPAEPEKGVPPSLPCDDTARAEIKGYNQIFFGHEC